MYVGLARIEYRIPQAQSLKAKRHILRKLLDRVRAKFKVTANEVDYLDKWQRTAIGVAVLGADGAHVERMLSQILQFLDDQHLAEPLQRQTEVVAFGAEPFDGDLGSDDELQWEGDRLPDPDGLDALGDAARRARPMGDEP